MAWQNCGVKDSVNEILFRILAKQIAESVMFLCKEFFKISEWEEA